MRFKKVLIFLLVLVCIPCIFLFVGCGEDKKIKVRVFDNYVQWSYEDEDSWYNAISVDEIKQTLGETYKGDAGINGKQVEFRTTADYIQWHYVGDSDWQNLIAISELKSTDTTTSADNNPQGLAFYPLDDGTYGVGVGFANHLSNIVIPSSYNGKPVTTIVKYGFANNPDSSDFICRNLISITLPNTITTIDDYAFSDCSSLISINIPNGVTSIGSSAFSDCSSLMSISIPSSVTSIGEGTFHRCIDIKDIIVNENNKIYDSRDNCNAIIETKTNELLFGSYSTIIPISVIKIGKSAFAGCRLTSITIPASVISIGADAFSGCYALAEVYNLSTYLTINKGTSDNGYIGYYAMIVHTNKNEKSNIIKDKDSVVYYINNDSNIKVKKLLTLLDKTKTQIEIADDCTDIGYYAFYDCKSLESIYIPDSLTHVGIDAFYGCVGLKKISITDIVSWCKIRFVDLKCYYNVCNPLQYAHKLYINNKLAIDLILPENVTLDEAFTFSGCTSLRCLLIPKSVTTINRYTFSDCSKSLKIYSEATSKPSGWSDGDYISQTYWYSINQPTEKGQFWHYENGKIVEW